MDNKNLKNKIKLLNDSFRLDIIGKTYLGNKIFVVNKVFGEGFKWVIITGGIHAREHLSCDLICLFLNNLNYMRFLPYNISVIPLLNPDGADLCINGLKNIKEKDRGKLLAINGGGKDFSLFKANARGVDLNNNFDADFENKFSNKTQPSAQGYYGEKPFSEPETSALRDWTKKLNPFLTISYHLKGEEIYFDFFQDKKRYGRDFAIAKIFSKSTGYIIKSTQDISSGGYKDWCVQKLKIPALTIELGEDKFSHPFPQRELTNIYEKNKNIFNDIAESLKIFERYE